MHSRPSPGGGQVKETLLGMATKGTGATLTAVCRGHRRLATGSHRGNALHDSGEEPQTLAVNYARDGALSTKAGNGDALTGQGRSPAPASRTLGRSAGKKDKPTGRGVGAPTNQPQEGDIAAGRVVEVNNYHGPLTPVQEGAAATVGEKKRWRSAASTGSGLGAEGLWEMYAFWAERRSSTTQGEKRVESYAGRTTPRR